MPRVITFRPTGSGPPGGEGGWQPESYAGTLHHDSYSAANGYTLQAEQEAHLLSVSAALASASFDYAGRTLFGGALASHHTVPDPEGVFPGCVRNTVKAMDRQNLTGVAGTWNVGDEIEWRSAGTPTAGGYLHIAPASGVYTFWIKSGSGFPVEGNTVHNLTTGGTATFGTRQGAGEPIPGSLDGYARRTLTAIDHVWVKYYIRFSPGYTTAGSLPSGNNDSRKLIFVTWSGAGGRAEIEYANVDQRRIGISQTGRTFSETVWSTDTTGGLGYIGRENVHGEWDDGDWREIIGHYEIIDATTARYSLFWSRATLNGAWVDLTFAEKRAVCIANGGSFQNAAQNPYDAQITGSLLTFSSGAPAQVAGFNMTSNRNKFGHQTEMYEYLTEPFVIDGAVNDDPFGLRQFMVTA